ncbi:hypothetical protein LXL04_007874 [Taraxacum kok-saghyz]
MNKKVVERSPSSREAHSSNPKTGAATPLQLISSSRFLRCSAVIHQHWLPLARVTFLATKKQRHPSLCRPLLSRRSITTGAPLVSFPATCCRREKHTTGAIFCLVRCCVRIRLNEEAAFESAASSSSSSKSIADCDGDRRRTRRRLPDSLFNSTKRSVGLFNNSSSECNRIEASSSFSLLPCPRNRFSSPWNTSDRANSKMRYPAMTFKGHIVYSRTFLEVEKAADELLKFIELKKRDGIRLVIGLDIEWRTYFRKGVKQGKAAVLQICADPASCHVMHIIHSGFPESLKSLLGDSKSMKVATWTKHNPKVNFLLLFGDHIFSVDVEGNIFIWAFKGADENPSPIGHILLDNEFTPSCIMHPDTYLNKVILGGQDGSLQLQHKEETL